MIARGVARLAAWSPAHLLARAGFCAKAALYADIGIFALHRAWARHGPLLDVKDALVRLARSPFGPAPAAAAGVGIACLGAWFTVEAIVGTPGRRGLWAALSRVGQAIGGVGYVLLGIAGVRELFGLPAGPSGDALARSGVAEALVVPGGPLVAVVLGAAGVGVGIRQAAQGLGRTFLRSLELAGAPRAFRAAAVVLGTIGFTAQGALFAGAGALILRATLLRDPGQAAGTHGVLRGLALLPGGAPVLAALGIGLLAYAAYAVVEASARRFPPRPPLRAPSAPRRPTARTPADRTAS